MAGLDPAMVSVVVASLMIPLFEEVVPFRIVLLDQRDLPCALPAFYVGLALIALA
jgi:hypothetical protein